MPEEHAPYPAAMLTPTYLNDHPVAWEPPFPDDGSELEKVQWLAGKFAIEFTCQVEVVVNPYGRPPGFGFNFYARPGDEQFSMRYVGADASAVAAFVEGMACHRSLSQRGVL